VEYRRLLEQIKGEQLQLRVQLLNEDAKLPTVGHPGEDIGYDLYSAEEVKMFPGNVYKVHTGIAVEAINPGLCSVYNGLTVRAEYIDKTKQKPYGLIIKDRSSMASKGVFTHGGVIDSGYRGEIIVLLTTLTHYVINKGDKIAQMVPVPVLTGKPHEVSGFGAHTYRDLKGFGSTGA
jgi:dUTP diphosphatase